MTVNKLPLLSNSFLQDLISISNIYKCHISKALIAAHHGKLPSTDFCTMVTARNILNEKENVETDNITFSFLPKDKEPEYSGNGNWSRKNRQTGKPAKIAQSLLELDVSPVVVRQIKVSGVWHDYFEDLEIAMIPSSPMSIKIISNDAATNDYLNKVIKRTNTRYTAKMYEVFANNVKSFYECRFVFKIFEGKDVNKHYSYKKYFDGEGEKGTLWGSCMRDVHSAYFDFYSMNGVKLLVAFHCDKVVGRALLWPTHKGIMMDRIYSYWDYLETLFINYAKENQWMYKTEQSSGDPLGVWKINEETGEYESTCTRLEVQIPNETEQYPYCDTFKHYNGHGMVHNDDENTEKYLLESTDGDRIDEGGTECIVCHQYYDEGDMHFIERHDGYACENHAQYTVHEEYELSTDCCRLYSGDYALISDTVRLYNGRNALEEEVVLNKDGSFILEDESVELYDGTYIHKDQPRVEIEVGAHKGGYALLEQTELTEEGKRTLAATEEVDF